jgi:hypothetical protein
MNKFAKVEGHHDLYRDNTTGAIINTDKSIFNHTKKSTSASGLIKNLQTDVETLKSELSEIKHLLREIAGK